MKLIFVMLMMSGVMHAFAQQKPYFTQYILNNYILNPAITGIENYTDVKLSYRNQWTGINGAPVTMYVSAHGPIGKKDYRTTATSFQVPGENPRGKAYWESYTAPEAHHGAGLILMNDKTGYISRFSAYATLAYHKGLTPKTSLSAGFLAGMTQVSLDRSKIEWATLDPNDPAIGYTSTELKKIKPEVGAGLWLYSSDYFAGVSVLNIIPGKAKFKANSNYGSYYEPQFLATAGYRFFLSDDISALPSVMLQFIKPFPVQTHVNIKLQFQDKVWIGASGRVSDELGGFAAMAGIFVSNTFNIAYSYDASTTSRLKLYTKNTHELIIGFPINNKYGDTCPKNIW
ncbi:PorP/SprF family type IX secretion system membrane protein [Segetibacter koreensis]|uniref:PorP/SprF family type IX secretion system membrane protein n=1 Tax=Segetibacter koreensis TaxID=398037 RepID=UPI00039A714E|nr:type IX secretion system membrane protein PorP/SprF [Segetibacter koreensis]